MGRAEAWAIFRPQKVKPRWLEPAGLRAINVVAACKNPLPCPHTALNSLSPRTAFARTSPLWWQALHSGGTAMDNPYPNAPGVKGPDGTSQEAAAAIQPDVTRLRRLALRTLGQLGAATVLEAVPVAGVARESLQPRFSELRAMGFVEATGERRRNPSGKSAAVLRLTDEGRAAL